jgi:hypothetical protein
MDFSNEEIVAIRKAAKSVGGLPSEGMTAAQLDRFSRVAHEENEARKPLIVKQSARPVDAKDDATKRAEREVRLTEMLDPERYSPNIVRCARRALQLLRRGDVPVEKVEGMAWSEYISEITDHAEEMKALKAARDNAQGADAPIVRAAITEVIKVRLASDLDAIVAANKRYR